MRKLLTATAMLLAGITGAAAADMAVKAPPPPPPAFSWTGFYLGVNLGGGWTNSTGSATIVTPAGAVLGVSGTTSNATGVVGGGQIGYNWQAGNFVLGVEADFDGSGERNSNTVGCFAFVVIGGCSINASANVNWFSTVRGRLGWAADRWLFYVTGGGAWQNVSANASVTTGAGTFGLFSNSATRSGWVVGGGVETAVWNNWILGAEYLYLNTGNWGNNGITVVGTPLALLVPVGSVINTSVNNNNNIIRLRASYKF